MEWMSEKYASEVVENANEYGSKIEELVYGAKVEGESVVHYLGIKEGAGFTVYSAVAEYGEGFEGIDLEDDEDFDGIVEELTEKYYSEYTVLFSGLESAEAVKKAVESL